MRRYWVPEEQRAGDKIVLRGEILHHIRDVCRMTKGSKFEVILAGAQAHLVEIIHESKHDSIAQILETRLIPPLPEPHVHLALSIPRLPVFEAVLEKAVELGVKTIHPFYSDYSFIRGRHEHYDKKAGRFAKIIQGATQQSGRGELMEIAEPVTLNTLLGRFLQTERAGGLFAYEGTSLEKNGLSLREAIEALRVQTPTAEKSHADLGEVWVFVGSEGGFSAREVEVFREHSLKPVTLGGQVLRVETACVTLVGIIKYGFDLMR